MCAPKLLPKYVAKLQLECLPHCATQSHFLRGAGPEICIFPCQDAILLVSSSQVNSGRLLSGLWLTVARLFILVCALRLQRPSIVVAVNFLLVAGVISIYSARESSAV